MFASPWFLWALLAVGIPLMLHLFQKRRTVHVLFPTVQFLKAAQRRSSSRVRFENFLLWLLRTLLIIALVLAFAEPVLRSASGSAWLGRVERDVAIVLDGSYSMDYDVDRGKAWKLAKEAAEQVVRTLQPGDRVCVFLAAGNAIPVIEKPTAEFSTVLDAIAALECSERSSRLDEAVAMAFGALESGKALRRECELFVITDGQALPWRGFQSVRDPDDSSARKSGAVYISREDRERIPVYVLLTGAVRPLNVCVSDVDISHPLSVVGQSVRVRAEISRIGPEMEVPVSLFIDGKHYATRSVKIDADSSAICDFPVSELKEGNHVAEIRTQRDALELDDGFKFLMRVRGRLPMLVVGPPEASAFLRPALAPGAKDAVKSILARELETVDLRNYRAVFLSDAFPLSGQAVLNLEAYAEAGGVVVVFPGESCDLEAYSELKILPAQPEQEERLVASASVRTLKRFPPSKEGGVDFTLPLPPGTVPMIALKKYLVFGELAKGAGVLIGAGDDIPLLFGRACGRGRVFVFSIGATRQWSSFPISAFFVPVVHQLVRLGAGSSVQPPHLRLGERISALEAIDNYRESNVIFAPSKTPLAVRDFGKAQSVVEALPETGIYHRQLENAEPEPVMAVNSDRFESQLAPVRDEQISEWTEFRRLSIFREAGEMVKATEDSRNGRSFTEWMLWLALVLSLAEWWYANEVLRSRKGAVEKLRISLSGKVTDGQ